MELVVVILVMALLAAVGVVAFNQISSNARIAAAKAELTTVAKAAVAELKLREASAFDALWVTPLYAEVITAVDAGETAASGVFTPLGPDTPLTAAGQYGLAFKDLTGQVNATQGVGVTFATWVDGTVVAVGATAAGTIADHEAENTAAWAGDALNTAVQERTNLAVNPSFEKTSGTVTVRTNLHTDPRGTQVAVPPGGYGWGGFGWSTGGDGNVVAVAKATDGPLPGLSTYVRRNWTTAPTSIPAWSVGVTLSLNSTDAPDVTAGQTYTFSFYVRPSFDIPSPRVIAQFIDESGTVMTGSVTTRDPGTLLAGQWTRLSLTATIPDGAVKWRPYFQNRAALPDGSIPVGATLDATGALIERSPVLGEYFDGDTPPVFTPGPGEDTSGYPTFNGAPADPDITPAWTGAAHASTSVLRGAGVSYVQPGGGSGYAIAAISSTRWPKGGRSVRIIRINTTTLDILGSAGYTAVNDGKPVSEVLGRKRRAHATAWTPGPTGKLDRPGVVHEQPTDATYSRSDGGAPKAALPGGEVQFSSSYTVSPTATWVALYLPASSVVGESVWWDNLVAEDTTDGAPTDSSYFDGDTPCTARTQYRWAGTPHASKSLALAW